MSLNIDLMTLFIALLCRKENFNFYFAWIGGIYIMAKPKRLKNESYIMHKLDNIHREELDTTDLYSPKKGTNNTVDTSKLFNDEYNEKENISSNGVSLLAIIITVVVILCIGGVAAFFFLSNMV